MNAKFILYVLNFKIKLEEKTGDKLVDILHQSNLWRCEDLTEWNVYCVTLLEKKRKRGNVKRGQLSMKHNFLHLKKKTPQKIPPSSSIKEN